MSGQGEMSNTITEALMALPQVTDVSVDVETVFRVTVTIDSEPFCTGPRYEVYEVEAELIRRYPYSFLDFRLTNPGEGG